MPKLRALAVGFAVIVSFVFAASSARADAVNNGKFTGSANAVENMRLHLPDVSQAEEHAAVFAVLHFNNGKHLGLNRFEEHSSFVGGLPSNNGKHLGFSVAAIRRGPQFGLVRPHGPTVTQNPEPATMLLLGTGLTAVGAAIRRRRKLSNVSRTNN